MRDFAETRRPFGYFVHLDTSPTGQIFAAALRRNDRRRGGYLPQRRQVRMVVVQVGEQHDVRGPLSQQFRCWVWTVPLQEQHAIS